MATVYQRTIYLDETMMSGVLVADGFGLNLSIVAALIPNLALIAAKLA